ncbi:MAG: hypothetical protein HRU18_08810 [Pseudoalteromonas sp.]|uniref:hypothetical protein n=1 Tax=Pseudoalteromonas sp. TaxID=53249 RepID=UPI001D5FAB49|nr:hypothetical protein [Pseudoalteromonas sp.]NRA78298.1 hypothetical protein [Pseudoalteromonas sp.]
MKETVSKYFTKLRKRLFNICSQCEQTATHDVYGTRYCTIHLNAEFQRVMEAEAKKRGIE